MFGKARKPAKAKSNPQGKVIPKKYVPYDGPVVNARTYDMYKTPLERANAQRREEAHRRGQDMYKAKVWIPEHNGVKAHFAFIEKFVTTKPINSGNNEQSTPEKVQGVHGGQHPVESGSEAEPENSVSGVPG